MTTIKRLKLDFYVRSSSFPPTSVKGIRRHPHWFVEIAFVGQEGVLISNSAATTPGFPKLDYTF